MDSTAMVKRMPAKKVKYSNMESKLLGLLSFGTDLTIRELADKIYGAGEAPYYAKESVNSVLAALIRKIDHNKESFRIIKTPRAGPHPTVYKKQRR